jgi:type I restriction enzyme S subunit
LIELLQERRIALINQVVTKGLDPKAKLVDSGVDWIGEIPEGWEIKKLKFVSNRILTGKTPPTDIYEYYDNGDVDWYTPGDLGKQLELGEATKKITAKAILDNKVIKLKEDIVLLVGIGATLGKVGIASRSCTFNQQINGIEVNKKVLAKYLLYYLFGNKESIVNLSNSSTIGIFNQEQTKNFYILFPNTKEQKLIIDYLDRSEEQTEITIKKIKKRIDLLEECKKSIIYNAVTGKIKV